MATREGERSALSPLPENGTTSQAPAARQRERQLTIPPQPLDELEERYAQRPDGAFAPEQAIDEQIADLEAWATVNVRHERLDLVRFWMLRGAAFIGAVTAAAGGAIQMSKVAIIGGVVSALAIAIDAAWPTTADRNARRRAIHDLRELQHTLKLKWDKVRLAYPNPQAAKRVAHALALLDATQTKREEIGKYLGDATPGVTRSVDS
jgi:hypothetical protein